MYNPTWWIYLSTKTLNIWLPAATASKISYRKSIERRDRFIQRYGVGIKSLTFPCKFARDAKPETAARVYEAKNSRDKGSLCFGIQLISFARFSTDARDRRGKKNDFDLRATRRANYAADSLMEDDLATRDELIVRRFVRIDIESI